LGGKATVLGAWKEERHSTGLLGVDLETLASARDVLLAGLNDEQKAAVQSGARRLLVVAGAGAGKTEVMARRIAWLIAVEGLSKSEIVAFTFTERAAEEMKFRIRRHVASVASDESDATLGDMYVGTIHAFCLNKLRELSPDEFHNYDVIDDVGRLTLVQRSYGTHLGLARFLNATQAFGMFDAIDKFLRAYDILNEYGEFKVRLPAGPIPGDVTQDREWCKEAVLLTKVGKHEAATTFAESAARYYALLRSRHFLDFSTAQNELLRLLERSPEALAALQARARCVVVDEVQDLNPVQKRILDLAVGDEARLVAVGDHRQAIFGFRGGLVKIMGEIHDDIASSLDGQVVDLTLNYRSTPRIIDFANAWAATIDPPGGLPNVDMRPGNISRLDYDASHVGVTRFADAEEEAEWVAARISEMVSGSDGARHDVKDAERGLGFADIAVLLRSSSNARKFMRALERHQIPAVFRAGPDLFSQPEVLLFLGALASSVGLPEMPGRNLPKQVEETLGVAPAAVPDIVRRAVVVLRDDDLELDAKVADRLLLAGRLIQQHLAKDGVPPTKGEVRGLRCEPLKRWLLKTKKPRRVFPQDMLHWLFSEAGVSAFDDGSKRGESAMFHLGALSAIITGIEASGWTSPSDFKFQIISLCLWGTKNARTDEAPLLVQPSAVTIATIHAVKGLEFAAVFLADVRAQTFPSNMATRVDAYPFDGPILRRIVAADHADNANHDAERRLMYVALTRAERYLSITAAGPKQSSFYRQIEAMAPTVGGVAGTPHDLLRNISRVPTVERSDFRLVTSFSDLRYYLECPHDFYLRKVLGFAPTIDQAFGYGRGVHNLLRAVHTDPAMWADLAKDPIALRSALKDLIDRGLFYLRYTTSGPLENLKNRAEAVVADYVGVYREELSTVLFEPERPFETLLEEAQALVTGAIDLVRLDNPPRVSLIDFKSGQADSENASKLDEEEMRLQIALYGVAAKKEMEYEPDLGFVRYIGETRPDRRELPVSLDGASLASARATVVETVGEIKARRFRSGPKKVAANGNPRCSECDFTAVCGMPDAKPYSKTGSSKDTPDE